MAAGPFTYKSLLAGKGSFHFHPVVFVIYIVQLILFLYKMGHGIYPEFSVTVLPDLISRAYHLNPKSLFTGINNIVKAHVLYSQIQHLVGFQDKAERMNGK